jgi:citrate synthase
MGDLGDKKGIGNLDDPKMPFDYSAREYGTVPLDDKRARFQWVSEVAYKNVHRIVARGYDTTELMEEGYGVVTTLFVDFQARIPLIEEEQMLNYIMILSLEDGLSTPAVMSRMVAKTKTFLTQACGAAILSFGHAYAAYSSFGNLLDGYLVDGEEEGKSLAEIAETLATENLDSDCLGVSSLMLNDPTASRMIARAEKLGIAGKHIEFMKLIEAAAQKASDKPVAIDMLGAIGATMMDLGFTPEATWAILAVTRSFGAGAHYIEEVEREDRVHLGETLTPKEDYDGPEDRPVPPLADRDKVAVPAQSFTPEEWKKRFDERKKIHGSGFAIIEEVEDPSKMTGTKSVGKKLH